MWDWVEDENNDNSWWEWGWNWWNQPRGHYEERRVDLFIKTLTIDSAAELFDVHIANDLGIFNAESINVHVKFTESLTRKVIETSDILNVVNFAYESMISGSETLVPNQPYNFKVSMRRVGTGVPVSL